MGVEFEMYALPSFSSCWDEDVLKFLYWLILAFDLKFEMSFMYSESNCGLNAYWFKKEDCCKGGGGEPSYIIFQEISSITFVFVVELSEIISKKLNFPFESKLEISAVVCASQKWMFGSVIQNTHKFWVGANPP